MWGKALCFAAFLWPSALLAASPPDMGLVPDEALTYWTQQASGPVSAASVEAMAQRAGALIALGRAAEARAEMDRATRLANRLTATDRARACATVHLANARLAGTGRDYQAMLDSAQAARNCALQAYPDGAPERALAEAEVASALASLGRNDEALRLSLSAWDAVRDAPDAPNSPKLAIAAIRAATLSNARRSSDAETVIRQAIAIAAALPAGHRDRVQMANRLGYELVLQGRMSEALPHLRRAVDEGRLSRAVPPGDLANYVGVLGLTLLNMDRPEEAADMLQYSLDLFRKTGIGDGQASIMVSAGTAADRSGDVPRAIALREEALRLMTASAKANPLTMALARFKLAQSYAHGGRLAEAEAMEAQAVEAIAPLRPDGHYQRTNSAVALGWIKALRGDVVAGNAVAKPALRRLIDENRKIEVARNKVVGVLDNIEAFSQALDTAVRAGDRDFAFEVMQILVESDASRAAAAASSRQQAGGTALGDLLRERQEAAAAAQEADAALVKALSANAPDVDARRHAASAAAVRLEELSGALGSRFPGYGALLRPLPVAIESVQGRLRPHEALILSAATEEGLFTVAVTGKGMAIGQSPARRSAVRQWVKRIRSGLGPFHGAFDIEAARALHDAIFTPKIAALVTGAETLVVGADDILSAIPFSLLVTGMGEDGKTPHWLIEDKAIWVAPSLAALGQRDAKGRPRDRFVGVGAPQPTDSSPAAPSVDDEAPSLLPLVGAESELNQMAAILGRRSSLLLTGADATEARLRATPLANLRVLAFATHGLVGGEYDQVGEPALLLSPATVGDDADSVNDGKLTASEAALLHIDADWVILSACDTAAGDRPNAAGYTGLARAFLFAGAHRVMASHWPVRDDASARLTVETVRGVERGLDPAMALRRAMLKLMRDRRLPEAGHPSTWAPFMLVGR